MVPTRSLWEGAVGKTFISSLGGLHAPRPMMERRKEEDIHECSSGRIAGPAFLPLSE